MNDEILLCRHTAYSNATVSNKNRSFLRLDGSLLPHYNINSTIIDRRLLMSIRFASKADLPAMLAIYSPYVETTAYSFEYTPPTPEEFAARFDHHTAQFPWLVWEESGKVLGYAYGSAPFSRAAYGWCAEVSIYLSPSIHGKGVGRALYTAMEKLLDRQGYYLIYAIVTSSNTGSLAFHKAMGYRETATFPLLAYKFGSCHSVTWLEKRLKPVEYPSKMPIPVTKLVNTDRNFL